MRFSRIPVVAITCFAFLLMPSIAEAKGPRGEKGAKSSKWSTPPGWSRGRKTGWRGEKTPPGWKKGRKTGWRGLKMPRGLFRRW